jgi:MFS family permease
MSNFQLLQGLMAVVTLLHAADGAMLPGIFKALEEGLDGATPVSLGTIVFAEAMCHSVAVLVWGGLADRWCKLALLMYASLSWGLLTLATACVEGVRSLFVVRAFAGIVSAAIGPVSQGLIGAVCKVSDRGRAFGFLTACGQFGYMFGLLMAGSTSHLDVIYGWRGSFVIFALLTLGLGWILWMARVEVSKGLFRESRSWAQLATAKRRSAPSTSPVSDVYDDFVTMFKRKSFWVLLLQGAFASTTVKAMQYQTMWFQYVGFTDLMASAITSAVPFGCMTGAVMSGYFSDWIARLYPIHGRIFFAQFADLCKLSVLFYTFVICATPGPNPSSEFAERMLQSFLFGFLSIMTYASVIKPLFAEIVPAQMIAQTIAVAAAFDGAFSSIASTPVVGFITEHIFHYQSTTLSFEEMPAQLRERNANALGRSIAAVTLASAALQILSFSLLHLTYPKDSRASRLAEAETLPAVEEGEEESSDTAEEEEARRRPSPRRVSFNLGSKSGNGYGTTQ